MRCRNVSSWNGWCLVDNTQIVLAIILAVMSSSVLTRIIDRFFSKKNDAATVHKTEAETADILSQAADRTLQMMHQSMVQAQARIMVLEERVSHLEKQVLEYERLHGPLQEIT
jgi:sensor histidine kinase YesM